MLLYDTSSIPPPDRTRHLHHPPCPLGDLSARVQVPIPLRRELVAQLPCRHAATSRPLELSTSVRPVAASGMSPQPPRTSAANSSRHGLGGASGEIVRSNPSPSPMSGGPGVPHAAKRPRSVVNST
jgi:hypothetical protein